MDVHEISFENLPKAVAHLVSELAEIKFLVEKGQQTPVVPQKRVPIGIEDACRIIGKAKPTVYAPVITMAKSSTSLRMSYWNVSPKARRKLCLK